MRKVRKYGACVDEEGNDDEEEETNTYGKR